MLERHDMDMMDACMVYARVPNIGFGRQIGLAGSGLSYFYLFVNEWLCVRVRCDSVCLGKLF